MAIVRNDTEIARVHDAAGERTLSTSEDEYAEGVYDTLQWLTGNAEDPPEIYG